VFANAGAIGIDRPGRFHRATSGSRSGMFERDATQTPAGTARRAKHVRSTCRPVRRSGRLAGDKSRSRACRLRRMTPHRDGAEFRPTLR
jgi:hypothetical protein